MEQALATKLRNAGVSEEAIGILDSEELSTEEALKRGFSYEQFRAMGIKAGSARRLTDLFPLPQVQQSAQQPTKIEVNLTDTSLENKSLLQLVQMAVASGLTPELKTAIKTAARRQKTFVVGADGGIDWNETLKMLLETEGNIPEDWEGLPIQDYDTASNAKAEANPINGKRLVRSPWQKVDILRREALYYHFHFEGASVDESSALRDLSAKNPGPYWERVILKYSVLKRQRSNEAVLSEQAMYYKEGPGQPFRLAASVIQQQPQIQITAHQQLVMPELGPIVPADFRSLTEFYIAGDKDRMHSLLYQRGLFLVTWDLNRQYIDGVPLEALCLLRAGSDWKTFESANQKLQAVYADKNMIVQLLGQPNESIYSGLQLFYPNNERFVTWCKQIMYDDKLTPSNLSRPSPGWLHGYKSWSGKEIAHR